jgi:hypothetical protein
LLLGWTLGWLLPKLWWDKYLLCTWKMYQWRKQEGEVILRTHSC